MGLNCILVLLAFLLNVQAIACSEFRLDAPGGSMEHVPVLDQGALGICYAATAAQLIDAWVHTKDPSKRNFHTSPLAYAVESKHQKYLFWKQMSSDRLDEITIAGGEVDELLFSQRPPVLCPIEKVEGAINYERLQQKDLDQALAIYRTIRDHGQVPFEQLCPFSYPGIEELIKNIQAMAPMEFLRILLTHNCGAQDKMQYPQNITPVFFPPVGVNKPPAVVVEKLGDIFDSMEVKQPIAIGYCAGLFMRGRKFEGIKKEIPIPEYPDYITYESTEDCGRHASLIIGRRSKKILNDQNQEVTVCQYLIRNSWGTEPQGYHKDWDHEEGNIWVDEDTLKHNVFSLYYLSEEKK